MAKNRSFFSKSRFAFFIFIFLISFLLIFLRLYQLQIKEYNKWKSLGKKEYSKSFKLTKKRGEILDSNLSLLATSIPIYSVFMDPKIFTDNELIDLALDLSKILNINAETFLKRVMEVRNYRFMWIKRKLSDEEYNKIKALNIKGIYFKREYARKYPEKNLAAQILGFVGVDKNDILDNKGLEGLEYKFDSILAGKFVYISPDKAIEETKNQSPSLVLTIDSVIQQICEENIKKVCEKYNAENGKVIVIESSTGKILAMANFPFFDPNKYKSYKQTYYKNRCVTDLFEPGSTFKMFTMASALEINAINLEEKFLCEGSIIVDTGSPIKCHAKHGELTPKEIIAKSCNPGIIQIAYRIGTQNLYEFIDKFNFLKKTKVDLPGDIKSRVKPWQKWYSRDLASIAFGQGIATTSLHMVQAFSAIANKGIIMKPYVVEKITDAYGATIKEFKPQILNKVISPKTASILIEMGEEVVKNGTGKKAYIKGYKVSGKTGTAQKFSPKGGYLEGHYISSFIGIIPADNPKMVIYVEINDPKTGGGYSPYGGVVAAPVFAKIAEKVMKYKGIFPAEKIKNNSNIINKHKNKITMVPNFIGMNPKMALIINKKGNFKIKIRGEGNIVIFQLPKPNTPYRKDMEINLYLGKRSLYEKLYIQSTNKVPNFIGKSLKEVLNIIKNWKNPVKISGSGRVISQYPPTGTLLTETLEVRINLSLEEENTNENFENTKEISGN